MSTPVRIGFEAGADVATVLALISSPRWVQARERALSDGSRVEEHDERADGGVLLTVSRVLPKGAPAMVERFLPSDGRVLQTDDWAAADSAPDGERRGIWDVELPGAPASMDGTVRLTPTADGCRCVREGSVTVRVPLIGGRAESFIADLVGRLTAKENEVLADELGVEVHPL